MDNQQAGVSSMARIRSIKPEFWTSEQVMESSPLARLLFIGIWNFCDDSGVHPLKPVSLKALIFPGDDIDSTSIRRLLDELSSNGLLVLYASDGKEYLQVTGWHHQRIDKPTRKYPTQENGVPLKTITYSQKFEESSRSTPQPLVEESDRERRGEDLDQKHCSILEPLTGELLDDQRSTKRTIDKSALKEWFAIFWKLYPRKVGKATAEKKFATKCKDQKTLDLIIASVGAHIANAWNLAEMNFIPHATTWLNQERWNDEVSHVRPTNNITNRQGSGPAGLSLVDQVRQRNEERAAERCRAAGQDSAQPAELFTAGMGERGGCFDGEFSRICDADGKIMGVDD